MKITNLKFIYTHTHTIYTKLQNYMAPNKVNMQTRRSRWWTEKGLSIQISIYMHPYRPQWNHILYCTRKQIPKHWIDTNLPRNAFDRQFMLRRCDATSVKCCRFCRFCIDWMFLEWKIKNTHKYVLDRKMEKQHNFSNNKTKNGGKIIQF